MPVKEIQVPKQLTRYFEIHADRMDEEKRSVTLSFSSDVPYRRFFGDEILDHGEGCDLSRLNNAAALLWMHNWDDQIGVVEKAWIDGSKGYADVRFSRNARAEEMWKDVCDGIKRNVSVGYEVEEMVLEKQGEDVDTYRVTRWLPLEISLVSVPADDSVGVGRKMETRTFSVEVPEEENTTDSGDPQIEENKRDEEPGEIKSKIKSKRGEGDTNSISERQGEENNSTSKITMSDDNEKMTAERSRVSEIHKLSSNPAYAAYATSERVQHWINEGASVERVQGEILESMGAKRAPEAPSLEVPEREAGEFSIVRAINQLAKNGRLDGVEKEISDATAKHVKREAQGFFIPNAVAKRALNANTGSAGGYTVDTDLQSGSMVDLLRNKTKVAGLGAQMLTGLVGDVAIPKHTGGATAYWLGETETVTDSQQTFGQITLTPHKLVGSTPYSKQLLAQSSIDVEGFIRRDIASVLAIAKDLACINGSGADGEPRGIMNTTGINAGVTFGGAATWADVVQFETDIYTDNAEVENMAFLTTPATQGKWKTIERATNTGIFLLDDDRMANGYRFEVTNQVPSDKVIFGNWADLVMADWDGIDVVVNPYSLDQSGQIRITVTLMTDVAVRHPVSFSVSTDSGAQ